MLERASAGVGKLFVWPPMNMYEGYVENMQCHVALMSVGNERKQKLQQNMCL